MRTHRGKIHEETKPVPEPPEEYASESAEEYVDAEGVVKHDAAVVDSEPLSTGDAGALLKLMAQAIQLLKPAASPPPLDPNLVKETPALGPKAAPSRD